MSEQIDIVEEPIIPEPVRRTEGARYTAAYQGGLVKVVFELRDQYQMLSVSTSEGSVFQQFSSIRPPLRLFDPAFAGWLATFMDEAKRRYALRDGVVA